MLIVLFFSFSFFPTNAGQSWEKMFPSFIVLFQIWASWVWTFQTITWQLGCEIWVTFDTNTTTNHPWYEHLLPSMFIHLDDILPPTSQKTNLSGKPMYSPERILPLLIMWCKHGMLLSFVNKSFLMMRCVLLQQQHALVLLTKIWKHFSHKQCTLHRCFEICVEI